MRISRISVTDILGTKQVDFNPGTMTVIQGANASGKSSVLKAIASIFEGGFSASMIREGAKRGTILLELADDNGKPAGTIKKTISEKGADLDIRDDEGREIKAPKRYIESLGEILAVDPSRLLSKKPKELVEALSDIVKPTFTSAELRTALEQFLAVDEFEGALDLDGLQKYHDKLYEDRSVSNRLARDADGTVKDLQRSLPASTDEDAAAIHQQSIEDKSKLEAELTKQLKEIDDGEAAALDSINAKAVADKKEIDRIAEENRAAVRSAADGYRVEERAKLQPQIDSANRAIGETLQQVEAASRTEGLKLQIEKARYVYSTNAQLGEKLTAALDALQDLKRRKLQETPVPGLEVRSDGVFLDGISFEHVNTARRVQVALEICAAKAGKLGFMLLDNTEALDTETWIAFQAAAKQSGYQFICARVGLGPLSISTDKMPARAEQPKKPEPPTSKQQPISIATGKQQDDLPYPD